MSNISMRELYVSFFFRVVFSREPGEIGCDQEVN